MKKTHVLTCAASLLLCLSSSGQQDKPGDDDLAALTAKAEQGDVVAQFHLGGLYWHGRGVVADFDQAGRWYRKAAYSGEALTQGYAPAQVALGMMYATGVGAELNLVQAHAWWNIALLNDPFAPVKLSMGAIVLKMSLEEKSHAGLLMKDLLLELEGNRVQAELEVLKLADSDSVLHLKDSPGDYQFRPAVRVMQDGTIWSDIFHTHSTYFDNHPVIRAEYVNNRIYTPEKRIDYAELRSFVLNAARKMRKADASLGDGTREDDKPEGIPDEALLIRADRFSSFRVIQKIMESCGNRRVQIWKLRLALDGGRCLSLDLPKDMGLKSTQPPKVNIVVKVLEAGKKNAVGAARSYEVGVDKRFVYDESRSLSYTVGERKFTALPELSGLVNEVVEADQKLVVTIDAREGTVVEDIVAVHNLLLEAGCDQIHYVGSYED